MFDDLPPMALITVVGTLGFIALSFIVFGSIARRAIKGDPEIRKNGIPAQAQILRTWDTGVRINGDMNVQVGMDLMVHPPSGSPYQTKAKAVINMVSMAQFQPGVTVPVKIHPTKPDKVYLDIYEKPDSRSAAPAAAPGVGPVQVVSAESLGIDKEALAAQLSAQLGGMSQAAAGASKSLSQQLEELEQAHTAGLLTDEEYERKRKTIVDSF